MYLQELKKYKTFNQLKNVCNKVTDDLQALPVDPNCVTILSNGLEVDELAVDHYPDDVPDKRTLYPCKTKADGNCLPSTGSIFAIGIQITQVK